VQGLPTRTERLAKLTEPTRIVLQEPDQIAEEANDSLELSWNWAPTASRSSCASRSSAFISSLLPNSASVSALDHGRAFMTAL